VKFLCRETFLRHFLDAYIDKRVIETIRMLPADEQELALLIDNGMRRHEAMREIGERFALSRIHSEKAKVRKFNAEAIRAAEEVRRKVTEERKAFMREKAEATPRASRTTAFHGLGDRLIKAHPDSD
jgi:hypothetical protein